MINAAIAMLDVLENWGVKHIYGIPGGSINSLMDALYQKRDSVRFIQVRHEEVGAMAASAHAKLTGELGVCFGSAGPGATHLFNGLYDAKMDRAPVLAIVGQVAAGTMNTHGFQEMNENPVFADVSVYNRTVMTAQSLPYVIDDAARHALKHRGVAVVTIPVNLPLEDIEPYTPSASARRESAPEPAEKDIRAALGLLAAAKRPVLYVGRGVQHAAKETLELAERFSLPVVFSVMAKGVLPDGHPNVLGAAARLGTKPAVEALAQSDLILFAGSDFPFAAFFFPKNAKFIQIDTDPEKFGRRHTVDVPILGDAGAVFKQMIKLGAPRPADGWLQANQTNRRNWRAWIKQFESRTDAPLRAEPVFREINRTAAKDAVFCVDVGTCTLYAARFLELNGAGQQFTTSGLFATMGYGLPASIGAKLGAPGRQVWNLAGDGGFSMVMQDILTQVRYNLPVINVVFSNDALGFIVAEQEDTNKREYGVDLQDADYAKAAEAMGAVGFTVRSERDLAPAFEAAAKSQTPVLIDVKLKYERPFPSEAMRLDPDKYSAAQIEAFVKRYEVNGMPLLKELLR